MDQSKLSNLYHRRLEDRLPCARTTSSGLVSQRKGLATPQRRGVDRAATRIAISTRVHASASALLRWATLGVGETSERRLARDRTSAVLARTARSRPAPGLQRPHGGPDRRGRPGRLLELSQGAWARRGRGDPDQRCQFEDLRAPRVVLDASEPTEVGLVSIRQLRRHRKRWIARVQRLEDILKVRHEITLGIPWDQAEAALVEAQDMVADLTAAIAAVEELHLRKAKFTKSVRYSGFIARADILQPEARHRLLGCHPRARESALPARQAANRAVRLQGTSRDLAHCTS